MVDFRAKERYNLRVMKILVVTGIFPPQIGGPAQYAKELAESFKRAGHEVYVRIYTLERYLPTGIRHLLFFLRALAVMPFVDYVIALDTFSVGFPAVLAAKLLGKKIVIRTGGDFLWEGYVERTGDLVLLKDFYTTRTSKWNAKERLIFKLTRWTLRNTSCLVFSTDWQRRLFSDSYDISYQTSKVIENYYGSKMSAAQSGSALGSKIFVGGTRPLKWKNLDRLKKAFEKARAENADISLDLSTVSRDQFLKKIENGYAVILVSLGDISPNMILDAISRGKPFILTNENGINERVKDIAVFVNPQDENDIKEKILWLCQPDNYLAQKKKVEAFSFMHTWDEIAAEFISVYNSLQ